MRNIFLTFIIIVHMGSIALAKDESIPARWPEMTIEDRVNYALGARDSLVALCIEKEKDETNSAECLDKYGFYDKDSIPALLAIFQLAYIDRDFSDAPPGFLLTIWARRKMQNMESYYEKVKKGWRKRHPLGSGK